MKSPVVRSALSVSRSSAIEPRLVDEEVHVGRVDEEAEIDRAACRSARARCRGRWSGWPSRTGGRRDTGRTAFGMPSQSGSWPVPGVQTGITGRLTMPASGVPASGTMPSVRPPPGAQPTPSPASVEPAVDRIEVVGDAVAVDVAVVAADRPGIRIDQRGRRALLGQRIAVDALAAGPEAVAAVARALVAHHGAVFGLGLVEVARDRLRALGARAAVARQRAAQAAARAPRDRGRRSRRPRRSRRRGRRRRGRRRRSKRRRPAREGPRASRRPRRSTLRAARRSPAQPKFSYNCHLEVI